MLMEINPEHIANVIKDRTGKYQDKIIECPDEKMGKELVACLAEGGVAPKNQRRPDRIQQTPWDDWQRHRQRFEVCKSRV